MLLKLQRKQRGISLLEVLLSLSVIAIILVMATRYYKSAQQSQQASNALSILSGIVTAETQYAAAHQNSYQYDINALISTGYLPNGFGTDPWGGTITIVAATTGGYTISFSSTIPGNTCQILNGMVKSGSAISTNECAGNKFSATYQ